MTSALRLLAGIRVLDAASFIAGPVATTAMADFAADVVKIETPGGDTYRVRNAGYPPSLYNVPWIPHDAQMRASGALVPLDDPRAGAALTVSSPLWIEGQDKVPAAMAPEIGEHTVDVLREAGVAEAEIERLLRDGVIVQAKT
jgi:crotonobetainyl-CoA:carnitine CoA-transferase CaiB-like acyl-CoA transferase